MTFICIMLSGFLRLLAGGSAVYVSFPIARGLCSFCPAPIFLGIYASTFVHGYFASILFFQSSLCS